MMPYLVCGKNYATGYLAHYFADIFPTTLLQPEDNSGSWVQHALPMLTSCFE